MIFVYLIEALGFISLVLLLFYKYMTSEYLYWKKRNVPYIKPVFPYGNIKDQVTNKLDVGRCFKALYDKMPGEKYFGIFELGQPTLILKDLNVIKSIMVTDFYHFADRGHIHKDIKKDYIARLHLFNLKNEEWKVMRQKLVPTFTSGRMKMMYHFMQRCSQKLDNFLENVTKHQEMVEFSDLLARFTSDSISSCLFGLETNAVVEKDSEVRKISRLVFNTNTWNMVKLMISINQPYIYELFGFEINHKKVKQFCTQLAKDTYDYRVKNNFHRDDFIDLLIKVKQKRNLYEDEKLNEKGSRQSDGVNDGLTFEEMASQVFVMFAAGFETSSTTSTMALYEMSQQPNIMKRAVREIDTVLARHAGLITYQALKEMVYLEKVIFETLRLYPSLPVLTRKCVKPYRVEDSDLVIEKGIRVIIPLLALNLDPAHFPEPERFDPERFKSKPAVSMQFGDGPMACIGVRFGKMQVKCALATVLSKYRVYSVPQTPKRITLNPRQFLTTPMEPIYLGISKREDNIL